MVIDELNWLYRRRSPGFRHIPRVLNSSIRFARRDSTNIKEETDQEHL
jgi:hypothetical protein